MTATATTFALLGRTDNEAATPVLVAALDAASLAVRTSAVRALLERRSHAGLRALIERAEILDDEAVHSAGEFHGRLVPAIREALLGDDDEQSRKACRAAVRFREYDVVPTLLNILEEPGNHRADAAAAALLDLADELMLELASIRDERRRRDPTLARNHATTALEQSAQRFPQHGRREPLEALLQVASRDNAALNRILTDPKNACFAPIVEVLSTSRRPGVLRLLVGLLDDPRPPAAALQAMFGRKDRRTAEAILRKIGVDPAPAVRANLRRVQAVAALADHELLLGLDDELQQAAVAAASASGLKQDELMQVLEALARSGKPGGRRAAVAAVAEIRSSRAAVLVLRALNDDDPGVRAAALVQLRPRGIPGALATLLTALDRGEEIVREAARSQLQEFSFRRFLPAFDLLDEEVRRTTGTLVAKIDPTSVEQLHEELRSSQTKRRVRGLEAASAMGLVEELRGAVTTCTADDEQGVRIEAARALATARGDWADRLLRDLQADEAFAVREAAREAAERRAAELADEPRQTVYRGAPAESHP